MRANNQLAPLTANPFHRYILKCQPFMHVEQVQYNNNKVKDGKKKSLEDKSNF